MPSEPTAVEQAISRALRDNLATVQRAVRELEQAVGDLVAACASSRPVNALPPLLRAQTASASLAAALEVMSRFVAAGLQPQQALPGVSLPPVGFEQPEPEAPPAIPPREIPTPMGEAPAAEQAAPPAAESANEIAAADMVAEGAPITPPQAAMDAEADLRTAEEPAQAPAEERAEVESEAAAEAQAVAAVEAPAFEIASLPAEEQELHRRANRVAKVSMQDIRMLHPEEVSRGREHRDICVRLREDIDKARKEYDRRFQPILHHPVDYFYHWMVEVLGNGDPETLGEYPYPSPVLRR